MDLGRVCDVSTLLLVKFQTVTENFFVHVVGKLHAASRLKKKKKEDFSCVLFRVLGVNVLRVPIKCTRWKSPCFPMKEVFCPFLAQAKRPGSERGL